jgi:hypothetical protein
MPRGPRGEKRPADVIGNAVKVMRIATGEETEDVAVTTGRVRSGKAGAAARALSLPREERTKIAKHAAAKRWQKE